MRQNRDTSGSKISRRGYGRGRDAELDNCNILMSASDRTLNLNNLQFPGSPLNDESFVLHTAQTGGAWYLDIRHGYDLIAAGH